MQTRPPPPPPAPNSPRAAAPGCDRGGVGLSVRVPAPGARRGSSQPSSAEPRVRSPCPPPHAPARRSVKRGARGGARAGTAGRGRPGRGRGRGFLCSLRQPRAHPLPSRRGTRAPAAARAREAGGLDPQVRAEPSVVAAPGASILGPAGWKEQPAGPHLVRGARDRSLPARAARAVPAHSFEHLPGAGRGGGAGGAGSGQARAPGGGRGGEGGCAGPEAAWRRRPLGADWCGTAWKQEGGVLPSQANSSPPLRQS